MSKHSKAYQEAGDFFFHKAHEVPTSILLEEARKRTAKKYGWSLEGEEKVAIHDLTATVHQAELRRGNRHVAAWGNEKAIAKDLDVDLKVSILKDDVRIIKKIRDLSVSDLEWKCVEMKRSSKEASAISKSFERALKRLRKETDDLTS